MKVMNKNQRRKAFRNLMDRTESKIPSRVIDSPTTEEYKKRRALANERVQQGVAEYAEAYISSGEFFIE